MNPNSVILAFEGKDGWLPHNKKQRNKHKYIEIVSFVGKNNDK